MPLFSSKLELTSAASSSGAALADVQFVRGAFQTIPNLTDLGNIPVSQTQHQQIVWVESESATYQATITPADYISTFTDTVAWNVFTGFGSGGGGASNLGDLTDVVTSSLDNGDLLAWNQSNTRWEPTTPATFTLDTGSSHFINGVVNLDIFSATGSYYAATKELQVTGSLSLRKDDSSDAISIYSGSVKTFGISGTGLLRMVTQSATPTVEKGALFLDENYNLWIGQE
tara:strand:+ start:839 stop:1525 length:687 start_codon:yes stop_codon:yes gene_type:complete